MEKSDGVVLVNHLIGEKKTLVIYQRCPLISNIKMNISVTMKYVSLKLHGHSWPMPGLCTHSVLDCFCYLSV